MQINMIGFYIENGMSSNNSMVYFFLDRNQYHYEEYELYDIFIAFIIMYGSQIKAKEVFVTDNSHSVF